MFFDIWSKKKGTCHVAPGYQEDSRRAFLGCISRADMEFELGFTAFGYSVGHGKPMDRSKIRTRVQTAGMSYLVLVSACAIPFLLITHTEYTPPNHHTAGNLVNLSRGTCRSKGQGVLRRKVPFFIDHRKRKLQPDVNQKEGHSFELHLTVLRKHGFWSPVMSSARPSGKSCWNGKPFYNWWIYHDL